MTMETELTESIVKTHYPHLPGNEIDRRNDWWKGKSNRIARRLGLSHNRDTEEANRRAKQSNLQKGRTHDAAAKRGKRRKIVCKMEQMRLWEGRERSTSLRIRQTTKRAVAVKWYLCKRYGYKPAAEPYTLLATPETRRIGTLTADGKRRRMTEQSYTEKYHIKFKEAI